LKNKITPKSIILNLEEIIIACAAFAMTIICSVNVFTRYVMHKPISWADEINICLLAWITFVGSAAGYKRNLHYGMDFILTRLPYNGRKVLRIIINILILLTCTFLTYHSFIFMINAKKVMSYTRLSYKYIDASAVVGFTSMTIYSAVYLYQAIKCPDKYNSRYNENGGNEK